MAVQEPVGRALVAGVVRAAIVCKATKVSPK
jgi:hypothetical protein